MIELLGAIVIVEGVALLLAAALLGIRTRERDDARVDRDNLFDRYLERIRRVDELERKFGIGNHREPAKRPMTADQLEKHNFGANHG